MAGTFATEIATRKGRWAFAIEVEGWGRRVYAHGGLVDKAYRLATRHPSLYGWTEANSDAYLQALVGPIHSVGESIDLRTGHTSLGTLEVDLADKPIDIKYLYDHGWSDTPITDLLAVQGPAHSTHSTLGGRWVLTAAVGAADAAITLADRADLSQGDALWIEREVMIVTAAPAAGPGNVSVSRGKFNTTAADHGVTGPTSEGVLYDRPQYVRGRRVLVYAYLFDSRTGEMMAEAQRRLIWRGTIDDWEYPCGGPIRLALKPNLGRLDRCIGRDVVQATLSPQLNRDANARRNDTWDLVVTLPSPEMGASRSWDYPVIGDTKTFYARWGDELVLCESTQDNIVTVTDRGLLGTEQNPDGAEAQAGTTQRFFDVLPAMQYPWPFFLDENGDTTAHPVNILLALITSTGTYDGTPGSGDNGDWDVLPANWGAGLPVAEINLETFESLRLRTSGVSFSRLLVGWDGKPVPLRQFLAQQILGPMGWFLYEGVGEDGETGLSLGTISDVYPQETVATIDEGDIVTGSWRMQGQLDQTLSTQTFRFDKDLASGTYRQVQILRRPEVVGRYPDDDAEISYDVDGVSFGDLGSAIMEGRANNFASWFATPLPLVSFVLRMSRIEVNVTEKVLLTVPDVPNPMTGTRGLDGVTAIVLSAYPVFDAGAQNGIQMTCMLIPDRKTGLWSPAGVVRSWDPVTDTATLEESEFSTDGAGDSVPIRDALGFSVNDTVMLLDRLGNVRNTDAAGPVVIAVEGAGDNTLEFDSSFTGAVPRPGDFITYVHYSASGVAPRDDWSSSMKYTVAQANDADGLLPNDDLPYVYGA